MPASYLSFDKAVPVFFGPRWLLKQDREWRGQTILEANKLNVVGPGCRVTATHFEQVHNHGVHGSLGITGDIMEEAESSDMEDTFSW